MTSEILKTTPPSGDFPEKHFGDHFNSRLWVKFTDNALQDWVGCFSKTYQTLDVVLTDCNNETALVVSGGQGYLVDISKRELIYERDELPTIESAITTTNPDYFLIGACYTIYVFNKQGLVRMIEPHFIVDGIYFLEQQGKKAIGHLYSGMYGNTNVGFELDLSTFELQVNEEIKYRYVQPFKFIKV